MYAKDQRIIPMANTDVEQTPLTSERSLRTALLRGWRRKCPNCGHGALLKNYLKVHDVCAVCREELHHHRADDGPAYLTILIVGHIMIAALYEVFLIFRPDPLVLFTIFAVGSVGCPSTFFPD